MACIYQSSHWTNYPGFGHVYQTSYVWIKTSTRCMWTTTRDTHRKRDNLRRVVRRSGWLMPLTSWLNLRKKISFSTLAFFFCAGFLKQQVSFLLHVPCRLCWLDLLALENVLSIDRTDSWVMCICFNVLTFQTISLSLSLDQVFI